MIFSILKKTIFIIVKSYKEINLINFNNQLKQIYMNLFSIIKSACKGSYYIIQELIDYFYDIIKYYHNYINSYMKKRKLYTIESINLNGNEILNDQTLQMNLCNINGWVDFLLNPIIYDFNDKETLIKLFNELGNLFSYLKINKITKKINQNLYLKLLNFIPYLNMFFRQKDLDTDKNKENNDNTTNADKKEAKINNIEKEKDIYYIYFKTLKIFFENNPSKSENIMNLKNLFKNMSDYLSENNQFFYKFNDFINELIRDNPDMYFNDDKDDEQIKLCINYADKFSISSLENLEVKNEKEINNKKNIFYKLITILIEIIFSK